MNRTVIQNKYWSKDPNILLQELESSVQGLSQEEAAQRLRDVGPNKIHDTKHQLQGLRLLWDQIKSPLTLLLIFAAILSYALYQKTDGTIILGIVFI